MSAPTPSAQDHPRAASIESGTGTPLATWVQRIEDAGGRDLDHAAIARLLPQRWDITEWWAQGVTIAYEQLIGRRVVGQSCDGDFAASASRTVTGDPDAVRELWDDFMTPVRREELGLEEPTLTDTATWRYWRAAVQDGTRVSVNITRKDGAPENPRCTLGLEHKRLETAEARDAWKAVWKSVLTEFAAFEKETR
ncbi:hypothetical protein ACFQS2_08625 [Brachybacterium sp. GCM10030267]|uniref:hypothetical protein n=1 Tax=unclassified Brachybacterium TaxID=2623841 RepID=UPI00361729B9